MTELEPAVIGDQLLRERLEAGGDGAAFTHWLGGSEPIMLAGTAIPGDVHLAVRKEIWTRPAVPTVDLSWTAPNVDAIMADLLKTHDLAPEPAPGDQLVVVDHPPVTVSVTHYDHQTGQMVDGWPENWPTQELQAITEEDQ